MTASEEGSIQWTEHGTYAPGSLLSTQYEVIRLLGSGASGTVYQCADHSLGGLSVAVKICPMSVARNKAAAARIATEILASHRVDHPNVVRFYGCIRDQGHIGLVMEYVDGTPLDTILEKGSKLTVPQCLDVLVQSARGLKAIHDCEIIHRDLKPSNIMVTKDGQIKITDFGIARTSLEEIAERGERREMTASQPRVGKVTLDGELVGTPEYISPEYIRDGIVDERSDIYALGVIGYELISGACPFADKSLIELLTSKVELDPPPLVSTPDREVPAALIECIRRALSRDADERYQRVSELLSVLETIRNTTKSARLVLDTSKKEEVIHKEEVQEAPEPKKNRKIVVVAGIVFIISSSFLVWEAWLESQKTSRIALAQKPVIQIAAVKTEEVKEERETLDTLMTMSTKVAKSEQATEQVPPASPQKALASAQTSTGISAGDLPHAKLSASLAKAPASGTVELVTPPRLSQGEAEVIGKREYAVRLRSLVGELINGQDGRLLSTLSDLRGDRSYPIFARSLINIVGTDRALPREVRVALLKALTDAIEGDGIEALRRWRDKRAPKALMSIMVLSSDRFTMRQTFDALASRDDLSEYLTLLVKEIKAKGAIDEVFPLFGLLVAAPDSSYEEYRANLAPLEKADQELTLWRVVAQEAPPVAITSLLLHLSRLPAEATLLLGQRQEREIRYLLAKRLEVASRLPKGLIEELLKGESDKEIREIYRKRAT